MPDKREPAPASWWLVEVLTGYSAARISSAWEKNGTNKLLREVERALARALTGVAVRLDENGAPDLERLRSDAVRSQRMRDALATPWLFATRPDLDSQRARTLLADVWQSHLFRFGTGENARGVPAIVVSHEDKLILSVLDDEVMIRGVVNRSLRYGPTPAAKATQPARALLLDLIAFPDPRWPIIERLERIPVLRPDGTLLDEQGFDAQTKTWLAPDFEIEPIPETPTEADVVQARAIIEMLLADFPFVAECDRTAAVALLLEHIVKAMIHGPRPLTVIDADSPGTGKTLLAKVVRVVATGERDATVTSLGRREEECEKRITSLLRSGNPVVILDNLIGTVSSESLQQLATSERFQARLLGVSELPSLPQNATWILTLNHAKLVTDIARRSVLIRLDAGTSKPWERRDFKIKDLVGWTIQHRPAIVRALLVLA